MPTWCWQGWATHKALGRLREVQEPFHKGAQRRALQNTWVVRVQARKHSLPSVVPCTAERGKGRRRDAHTDTQTHTHTDTQTHVHVHRQKGQRKLE